jgi:hypothetical protein
MNRRKIIGASLFFALFGLMAVLPPLVLLFRFDMLVFGIPVEAIYLFGLWVFLVIGACWFSYALPHEHHLSPNSGDDRP